MFWLIFTILSIVTAFLVWACGDGYLPLDKRRDSPTEEPNDLHA